MINLDDDYVFGRKLADFLVNKFDLFASEFAAPNVFDACMSFDRNEGGIQEEFVQQFPLELQASVRRRLTCSVVDEDVNLPVLHWVIYPCHFDDIGLATKWWDYLWLVICIDGFIACSVNSILDVGAEDPI